MSETTIRKSPTRAARPRENDSDLDPSPLSVLVIDDEPSLQRYFEYNIQAMGFRVRVGGSLADLFRMLEEETYTVLFLDLMLPDGESLDSLPQIVENYPDLSVALVSAHGTIPKAVAAIQGGAVNFLQKPVSPEQLESTLHSAARLWRLKREVNELRRKLEPAHEFQGMIGQSETMLNLYNTIEHSLSRTMAPVMITGESGTGKELVAKAIHVCGPRAKKPFIAINCAAIPRDLLESELFGHEKGAFTGAIERHEGCFERANKGTLFLDEICEMDLNTQPKLLRVLQEQSFTRVGGNKQIEVSVRIISATNRDPLGMLEDGSFREDLYYRLNVLPIDLPPLRERREDIMAIAGHFLREFTAQNEKSFENFDTETRAFLENYGWSGNVRELRNIIEQVVVLNDGILVKAEMLPEKIRMSVDPSVVMRAKEASDPGFNIEDALPVQSVRPEDLKPFWQTERDEIQMALNVCRGNVQEVARRMEISPATLYRKIDKYGLVK